MTWSQKVSWLKRSKRCNSRYARIPGRLLSSICCWFSVGFSNQVPLRRTQLNSSPFFSLKPSCPIQQILLSNAQLKEYGLEQSSPTVPPLQTGVCVCEGNGSPRAAGKCAQLHLHKRAHAFPLPAQVGCARTRPPPP